MMMFKVGLVVGLLSVSVVSFVWSNCDVASVPSSQVF
jgi:hypothetical protein